MCNTAYRHVLTDAPYKSLFVKTANQLADTTPDMRLCLTTVLLFPLLQWQLEHKDIFVDMQAHLLEMSKETADPQISFLCRMAAQRDRFAPQQYADALASCIAIVDNETANNRYRATFDTILGKKTHADMSRYCITRDLQPALQSLYIKSGRTISAAFNDAADASAQCALGAKNSDMTAALDCCWMAAWRAQKTIEHKNEALTTDFEIIAQIVNQAVDAMHNVPSRGVDYHKLAQSYMLYKPRGASDAALADMCNMSRYTFFARKKRLYTLMTAILFGGTISAMQSLMTDRY